MQKLSLLRLHNRAWLCRTNAPGPPPIVGAALAVVRKPSPLKGEGGWPKARRMRVLSRKVALRARESPPDIPLPLKSPLVKRGTQSGVGIPFPRDHSRRGLFFSVWAAHRGAWKRPDGGIGPYSRSNAPSDMPQGRTVCARGPPRSSAPTAKPEARQNFVGAAHLGRPPFPRRQGGETLISPPAPPA